MKRGVFLLVLNFINEREKTENTKKRFFKKNRTSNENELNRFSINVNGKNAIVLELRKKDLQCEDVLRLLKIYKGRVLVASKYKNEEILKEYLYSPKEYYQRALISSLVNQIKSVNKDWKNICVKIKSFFPFKEFYELVRISKAVAILTEANAYTHKFSKDCYYDFGAIVSVKTEISTNKFDIILDLDSIDDNGKLMINVKGKEFLLYPDMRFFENNTEYQKLLQCNIEHNIICAAFSNK